MRADPRRQAKPPAAPMLDVALQARRHQGLSWWLKKEHAGHGHVDDDVHDQAQGEEWPTQDVGRLGEAPGQLGAVQTHHQNVEHPQGPDGDAGEEEDGHSVAA